MSFQMHLNSTKLSCWNFNNSTFKHMCSLLLFAMFVKHFQTFTTKTMSVLNSQFFYRHFCAEPSIEILGNILDSLTQLRCFFLAKCSFWTIINMSCFRLLAFLFYFLKIKDLPYWQLPRTSTSSAYLNAVLNNTHDEDFLFRNLM